MGEFSFFLAINPTFSRFSAQSLAISELVTYEPTIIIGMNEETTVNVHELEASRGLSVDGEIATISHFPRLTLVFKFEKFDQSQTNICSPHF